MDRLAAKAAAEVILGSGFVAPVTAAEWDTALRLSVIPDASGLWPGHADYTPTYDPDWIAAELVSQRLLHSMTSGVVTSWASEGSRYSTLPADLPALERTLRARSIIGRAQGRTLERLDLERPATPHNPPRSHDTRGVVTNRS